MASAGLFVEMIQDSRNHKSHTLVHPHSHILPTLLYVSILRVLAPPLVLFFPKSELAPTSSYRATRLALLLQSLVRVCGMEATNSPNPLTDLNTCKCTHVYSCFRDLSVYLYGYIL